MGRARHRTEAAVRDPSTRGPVALADTLAREQELADVFTSDGQIDAVDVSELADDRFAGDLAPVVGGVPW